MSNAARRKARRERREERLVETAFNRYMDHLVDSLVTRGVDESVALDTIFHTTTYLAEKDTLPPYPDKRANHREVGKWLVAAADFGLVEFVVEAATG
jgi:hypothetical protein